MSRSEIRRLITHLDQSVPGGTRKAWAAAVIAVAGDEADIGRLDPLISLGEELGERLGRLALDTLGEQPTAYGKSAMVGMALDVELGAAILHPRLGKPLRAMIGGGKALIPSTVKKAGPGAAIDVPLHGKDDEWDFALLDAVEASVGGAPADREIVIVVALAAGGRAMAKIGRP